MPPSSSFQIELRGLLHGPDTDYELASLEGMAVPPVRVNDVERADAHGSSAGDDLYGPNEFLPTFEVWGSDEADLDSKLAALKGAWRRSSEDLELLFRFGGRNLRLLGRPRGAVPNLTLIDAWIAEVACRFVVTANPPLFEDADQDVVDLNVTTVTGGLEFPLVFPATFGGGSSGATQVTNDGNEEAYPEATITGPITRPKLTLVDTGEEIEIDLDVAAGDTLELDWRAKTVLLNGTASRYYAKTGTWWLIPPGTSEVRLDAGASGTGHGAQLRWRSTWA